VKLILQVPLGMMLSLAALAQHTAPAGHAGGVPSGAGFSAPRPVISAPAQLRPSGPPPSLRTSTASGHGSYASPSYSRPNYTSPIGPPPFGGTQPVNGPAKRYPYNGYRPNYRGGGYLVPVYLNAGYYGFGYGGDAGYADQTEAAPAAEAEAQAVAPDNGYGYEEARAESPARPPYEPQAAAAPAPALPEQPEITLFFKDGRPAQQVQNYAVTRTTVYVLDGTRRREIPLNQLDLPQTEKANRDAGLDFAVPAGAE
jgi:hypothetical protein